MEMTLRGMTVEPEKIKPFISGCHHLRFGECAARPRPVPGLSQAKKTADESTDALHTAASSADSS